MSVEKQVMNENSPLLGKAVHPQIVKLHKWSPVEACFSIASAHCCHSEQWKMYTQH